MPKVVPIKVSSGKTFYWFYCPGCKYGHVFDTRWKFNGDLEKPTFSPSLLVDKDIPELRCHSFVEGGRIRFLGDCWHDKKNTTVDLLDDAEFAEPNL